MTEYIEFPCGCCINEVSVIAMCLAHDVEMRQKREARRKQVDEWQRKMLESLRGAV